MVAAAAALVVALAPAPHGERDETVLDVAGTFVESSPAVLAYEPAVRLGPATVLDAVDPGPVSRGQVLVRLGSEALEDLIERAELELAQARHRAASAAAHGRRAEEQALLDVTAAELALADARRRLDGARLIDHPQRLGRSADGVRDWEVQRREAVQAFEILVGMYQADEVIETNERLDLESRQRGLDRGLSLRPHVLARHEVLERVTLPRELAALELAVRTARHDLVRERAVSAQDVEQARLDESRAAFDVEVAARALRALRRDREALTIAAPVDGHAVPGSYRGAWTALDEAAGLRPGAEVAPGQVLLTIVQTAPKEVRASIPEAMLLRVRVGQEAVLVPTAAPQVRLPATVTRVAPYSNDGRFEVHLEARTRHERLFPGSTCRVLIPVAGRSADGEQR